MSTAASTPLPDAAQTLLARRSPPPVLLSAPGPSPAQLEAILSIAIHVPDHGRMAPWRMIVISGAAKDRWTANLEELAATQPDPAKAKSGVQKLAVAPLVIVVVGAIHDTTRIPAWEQTLSVGALAMNLLNGAHAMGFGANWLTGWHAYHDGARALLGLGEKDQIAGVVIMGTLKDMPPERMRPQIGDVVRWLD